MANLNTKVSDLKLPDGSTIPMVSMPEFPVDCADTLTANTR